MLSVSTKHNIAHAGFLSWQTPTRSQLQPVYNQLWANECAVIGSIWQTTDYHCHKVPCYCKHQTLARIYPAYGEVYCGCVLNTIVTVTITINLKNCNHWDCRETLNFIWNPSYVVYTQRNEDIFLIHDYVFVSICNVILIISIKVVPDTILSYSFRSISI